MEQFATTNRGLTNAEVQERLAKYGPNALEAGKKKTMLQRFLDQFKDFMIIVLMAAALISGLVAQEWADSALIMLVVIINAILGVFQESKAEEAIDALKKMSTPDAVYAATGQSCPSRVTNWFRVIWCSWRLVTLYRQICV